jgi:prepilin-type N-terminal cleavage/methylation domain-containing protein
MYKKLMKMQSKLQAAKKKKGFSLVELMIVIAVIAILFVVLVSRAGFATNKAKETGVKTDFRAFSTAAEQMLRENSGLSGYSDVKDVAADLNLYLDDALKFDKSGDSLKLDAWNKAYVLEVVLPDEVTEGTETGATAGNNGALIFISGGQNGALETVNDSTNNDYIQATVWKDGYTHTATTGFSSNIEETYFKAENITAASAVKATIDTSATSDIKIEYNGTHDLQGDGDVSASNVTTNNGHPSTPDDEADD